MALRDRALLSRVFRLVLGVLLLALPLLRLAAGGSGWGEALESGNGLVVAFDLALLAGGLGFVLAARRWRSREAPTVAEDALDLQRQPGE